MMSDAGAEEQRPNEDRVPDGASAPEDPVVEQASASADPADERASAPANSTPQTPSTAAFRVLRVWPAGLLLVILWGLKLALPYADMSLPVVIALFAGPLVCAVLILLWWLFLSRASMKEKVVGIFGLVWVAGVTTLLEDKSMIPTGTMLYAVPWGITGFTLALICLARRPSPGRTWLALLAALACFGFWDLVRMDEMFGDMHSTRSWRWEPTAEDLFLQTVASRSPKPLDATAFDEEDLTEPEWPEFRGPRRDNVLPDLVLVEDWVARPPRELWRVRVGPGWSSFSVAGTRLFTQEQRGEQEVVVCYDAGSGAEIWVHHDVTRFWEAMGGAGPRATPTLADGNLFTLGATGLLQRLNPATGERVWQSDINGDAGREPPTWGYASSPLVTHDVVIVHAGGPEGNGMLAYDVETGELRWASPSGDHGYSSPQLSNVDGKQCVLLLTNTGITFVDPADGKLLGRHDWEYFGYRVVQPLVLDDSSVLLGSGIGAGTQRIDVRWDGEQFATESGWTSRSIKPDFNDAVAHEGYLYGFDNNIFTCIDINTGERMWKRGRYGNGQVLLLPEADQLLVISEEGELVLLRATPEELVELARYPVLEGRTWNHPVLVGNRLYVRNSEEAACFEMPLASAGEG